MMIFQLSWRNVWRNKLRSAVIILSVAAGLLAVLAALSLYAGMMKGRVRTVIDTETGHLQIHNRLFSGDKDPDYFILNSKNIYNDFLNDKDVKAFTQRTIAVGMLSTPSGSTGVEVLGINVEKEKLVSGLGEKLKEGVLQWPAKTHGIIIGKKLAKKMKLKIGNKLVLTITDTAENIISSAYRVKGIYQSANAPLDEIYVYVDQQDLQQLMGLENQVHEFSILLQADEMLSAFQSKYKKKYPALAVDSWKELSPETELMVVTVDVYSYVILLIILVALSFGIMNTMLMAVMERRHEIGMMMALGMGRLRLIAMILVETMLLTITGIPIAILIGKLLIGYYEQHGIDFSEMGQDMMESFGFKTLIYPSFPDEKLPSILLLVFFTALISSILPIWKSLRLDPVTALQK